MEWIIQGLQRLGEIRPEAIEDVFQDIREHKPDIFQSLVIIAYIDGEISLSKAAELLGLTRAEFQNYLKEKGIPVRSLSKEDIVAEAEMMRAWI